ncbi:MAG: N-acetylneuraminate synthase family protein [Thermoguttaceae bacterium]
MTMSDNPLFVLFEMANNHMGRLDHGLRIVREIHAACKDFPFRFGFKFQYRDLDTLLHPQYRHRMDLKYVKRFSETRLDADDRRRLKDEAVSLGFTTVCTPFDEASVDLILEHGYDILKIASCSFTDWPLLERVARTDRPVIASVAGVSLGQIDNVVAFFEHRAKDLTLMHCVAEYPTPNDRLQLNQIDLLKRRYGHVRVGYSTHEAPDNVESVVAAVAKGAAVLEKHVGVPTESIKLNAYSANPDQVRRWLAAAARAVELCGVSDARCPFSQGELDSLRSLSRGMFARRDLAAGERIMPDDYFLAMPAAEGQLTAQDASKYVERVATSAIAAEAPILAQNVRSVDVREKVYAIVQRVKKLLHQSGVVIPAQVDLEISHHYGIDRFNEFGLTMFTVVNREYCKKILVLLPGQQHPEQYHKIKEESFHVLYGDVWIELDGQRRCCSPGDLAVVERGVRHRFGSERGAVLEEVSLTHQVEDSFYTDPAIAANKHRKSMLTYWLR